MVTFMFYMHFIVLTRYNDTHNVDILQEEPCPTLKHLRIFKIYILLDVNSYFNDLLEILQNLHGDS